MAPPLQGRVGVFSILLLGRSVALVEGIGSGEIADVGGMADDADALSPGVQLERRRFHSEGRRGVGGEVQRDLMGRARAGRCDRPCEAELYRPVQMAAKHALHLRVPLDERGKALASLQAD